MFDGLLDSRRLDNTSPGDTPTLSLICHPMQVGLSRHRQTSVEVSSSFDSLTLIPAGAADDCESVPATQEDVFCLSAW